MMEECCLKLLVTPFRRTLVGHAVVNIDIAESMNFLQFYETSKKCQHFGNEIQVFYEPSNKCLRAFRNRGHIWKDLYRELVITFMSFQNLGMDFRKVNTHYS